MLPVSCPKGYHEVFSKALGAGDGHVAFSVVEGHVLIATFNVNSVKARLPFVLHWLEARQPDLVCLQELKLPDEKFPHELFSAAGYRALVHGQPRWNGVAVLCKHGPLADSANIVQSGLPGAEEDGARLITVQTDAAWVTSVYVPNGKSVEHDDFAMKLRWMECLREYLRSDVDMTKPGFVGGDFNIVSADIDSFNAERQAGSIFHTKREQAIMRELTEDGFSDLFRDLNPDERMFSWWDYRAGSFHKNVGLRIDLLMATESLRKTATKSWVDRDYRKKKDGHTPSDHAPVFSEV